MAQTSSPGLPSPQYEVPTDGVITGWSLQTAASIPSLVRFKAFRKTANPGDLTVVARGPGEEVTASSINTFEGRFPVEAGDVIGYVAKGSSFLCASITSGYTLSYGSLDGAEGETSFYSPLPDYQIPVAATLEPDADRDGYGDESQDLCPSDAATQKACRDKLAPQTTITERPPKKTTKKKASFAFTSSEPGSSFRCSLDGAAFSGCASPRSFKVKKGRHTFTVLAKDAAGNVDETPATVSWTYKKKRKKR